MISKYLISGFYYTNMCSVTTEEADREDIISQFTRLSLFPLSVYRTYLGKCWPSYIKECGAVERAWSCKSEPGFLPQILGVGLSDTS